MSWCLDVSSIRTSPGRPGRWPEKSYRLYTHHACWSIVVFLSTNAETTALAFALGKMKCLLSLHGTVMFSAGPLVHLTLLQVGQRSFWLCIMCFAQSGIYLLD